ncbi:hypothetical protein E2562_038742 [Oryza meyeriana var. granulata]|uniref:Uncharacterized protein n=1 Tax=Oryza meyeriana var. granulata TaxID=110450 RepID=A0A6G1CBE1_9ORYZ|nr:hypothetical protein E2562_038742 [Oryza meyeriana var. granulata]
MAARLCADSGGDGDSAPLALSVLHDLLGVAAFVASHPLHAAYALFFARHLLALACFFCPLLVTTSLLLAVLVTVGPYVGGGGELSPGVRSLGWTCGIAVGALRAKLRPNGAGAGAGGGAVALLGQLCSYVLGPGDAAAVLRVGEIMGELCDIGDSCSILEDKSVLFDQIELPLPAQLPWHQGAIDGEISMDQEVLDEIKDGIEEKKVVLEDLKQLNDPHFSSENCSASDTSLQGMEEHEQNAFQEQSLGSPDVDGLSDGVEEKRLECDPVSVEIKKCAPAKPHSSVSRRILQWEAQASGNFKGVLEEMEPNSVEFCLEKAPLMDFKECNKLEDGQTQKFGEKHQVEEIASVAELVVHQEEQKFKDVKECVQAEAATSTEKCSKDQQPEESTLVVRSEQEWQEERIVLPEPELQDQEYKDVESVKDSQDNEYQFLQPEEEQQEPNCNDAQPEQPEEQDCDNGVQPEEELQEEQEYGVVQGELEVQDYQEEFKDADQEPAREDPLMPSTSIARRVHSRTASENLVVGEGSPRKEKEWKRTLACKLYEERMQLKLCRDRAVVECCDNMDMLWEAYEVGVGGGASAAATTTKRGGSKAKRGSSKQERPAVEGAQERALKFSTRKMNFGGGKPSLAKISKVLRRMTALSRSGSRRSTKDSAPFRGDDFRATL